MSMDIDRDITINGNTFKAGKGVDTNVTDVVDGKTVKVDYADGIKEVMTLAQASDKAIEDAKHVDPSTASKAIPSYELKANDKGTK